MVENKKAFSNIKKLIKEKQILINKFYYEEVKNLLISPKAVQTFQDVVLARFRKIQSGYFSGEAGQEDPTRPSAHGDEIRAEVLKQLELSTRTIDQTGILQLTLLSDEFLGISTEGPASKKDPTPMRWIYYFLVGALDSDMYWVNQSSYEKVYKRSGANLGRFGDGFLLSPEKGSSLEKLLKSKGVPKHPQSNQPGNPDLFAGMSKEVDLKSLVLIPALNKAKMRVFGK